MKNICFIDNFHRSELFLKSTITFDPNKVFWITANYFFYKKFKKKKNILYLNKYTKPVKIKYNKENKFNEIYFSDRLLKKNISSYNYLKNFESNIYFFLKKKNINIVISEFTWGHELLTFRIINNNKDLKCKFYNIQPIRVPYSRSALFENEEQYEIKPLNLKQVKKINFNNNDYRQVVKNKNKPNYFIKIYKLFSRNYFHENDIYFESKYIKIKNNLSKFLHYLKYNIAVSREKKLSKKKNNQKFILYALQKQPEAGVDVKSRYYENSEQILENIYKTLSENEILFVKEHSSAIGLRKIDFFNKFKHKKNIFFLHESIDVSKIIKKFDLIITQAGTIAYEAAIKKITSFTFAKCFFNKLQFCHHINFEMLKKTKNILTLKHELNKKQKNKLDIKKFKKYIQSRSFEGIVSDTLTDPNILKKDNIEKVKFILKKITTF